MEKFRQGSRPVARLAIIGCGAIGSQLDEQDDSGKNVLTHAGAAAQLKDFELVALCDADSSRLQEAAKVRGVSKTFMDPVELLQNTPDLDCVAVCIPVEYRDQKLVEALCKSSAKVVLWEKPVALSAEQAKTIEQLFSASGKIVLVNYLRRWAPGIKAISKKIHSGDLGEYLSGHCVYDKGVANNGSHVFDSFAFLSGLNYKTCDFNQIQSEEDKDPTLGGVTHWGDHASPFYFTTSAYNFSSVFEIDLRFSLGRVQLLEKGNLCRIYKVEEDERYPGYRHYALKSEERTGLAEQAFIELYKEAYELFLDESNGQQVASCGMNQGVQAMEFVSQALKKWAARQNG